MQKFELCRKFEIDSERFPAVVFESDDWCACENAPPIDCIPAEFTGAPGVRGTLETPDDLEALFAVLGKFTGADGKKALFTAFTSMGNPDFKAIADNGFTEYCDIAVDHGFPAPWDGKGIIDKMLDGIARGVWEAEYHSMLHHTSPKLWLEMVRDGGDARRRFEYGIYDLGYHLPEYHGYSVREQFSMINEGFTRFKRIFGRFPEAVVTSDAFPETVLLWCAAGVKTVPLINCRVNCGETVVYSTKPWNFQDIYARIGDYSQMLDAVFLTRNAFLEMLPDNKITFGHSAAEVLAVCEQNRRKYEPSVISTHRKNYVLREKNVTQIRLNELTLLLHGLSASGVYFLSTGELGSLYRRGWSKRGNIFRKWAECALPEGVTSGIELPSAKEVKLTEKSLGNYQIQ